MWLRGAVLSRDFTAKYGEASLHCQPDELSTRAKTLLKDLCDKCVGVECFHVLLLLHWLLQMPPPPLLVSAHVAVVVDSVYTTVIIVVVAPL